MEPIPTFDELEPSVSTSNVADDYNLTTAGHFSRVPVDSTRLNSLDMLNIQYYTGNGYSTINRFLFIRDYSIYDILIYSVFGVISKKIPKQAAESVKDYNKKLLYYYFINLYTTIQKYPKSTTPFMIYRGSTTLYLKEDNDKKFYINSFMSTSYNAYIRFGAYKYIFYVHPMCNYMNISTISQVQGEDEVLFSPYHVYSFVRKNGNTHYYTLLPIDIDIPGTFETFMPWKDSHNVVIGGRHTVYNNEKLKYNSPHQYGQNEAISRMNNANQKNSQEEPTVQTVQTVQVNDPVVVSDFITRVTTDIPSFGGKLLTEKEKKMKQELIAFFEK